jgi:hypothetical protein
MRILGQSGNTVFEKHYQSSFITGLQEVVLARPSQAALCKEARKIRNRDPLAPKDLNDNQLAAIAKDSRLLDLANERKDLRNEICLLAGTLKAAKQSHPELYQKHDDVRKQQLRTRKLLRDEARRAIRNNYFESMPVAEVDKQIDQLLDGSGCASESEDEPNDEEDWEPPPPSYLFQERARIVENFYGPDSETLDVNLALTKRIQVTKDMITLCELSEPTRRGRKFDWDKHGVGSDNDSVEIQIQDDLDTLYDKKCSTDICIVCDRRFPRIDSLRRHLISQHLAFVKENSGISCTRSTCKDNSVFEDVLLFLNHAASVHEYDVKITLRHLQLTSGSGSLPRACSACSDTTAESLSDTATLVSTPQSIIDDEFIAASPMRITTTRCIFCTWLTGEEHEFDSPTKAQEHIKYQHLKVFQEDDLIPCPDLYCRSFGVVLFGYSAFNNHVNTVHS